MQEAMHLSSQEAMRDEDEGVPRPAAEPPGGDARHQRGRLGKTLSLQVLKINTFSFQNPEVFFANFCKKLRIFAKI